MTLAVAAAARVVLADGDVVLLGADSVTPQGISNKSGSWALAAAAHERRLPVYALASVEKWWPEPLPAREVSEDSASGGTVGRARPKCCPSLFPVSRSAIRILSWFPSPYLPPSSPEKTGTRPARYVPC